MSVIPMGQRGSPILLIGIFHIRCFVLVIQYRDPVPRANDFSVCRRHGISTGGLMGFRARRARVLGCWKRKKGGNGEEELSLHRAGKAATNW
jgi:hypothetical protein